MSKVFFFFHFWFFFFFAVAALDSPAAIRITQTEKRDSERATSSLRTQQIINEIISMQKVFLPFSFHIDIICMNCGCILVLTMAISHISSTIAKSNDIKIVSVE